MYMQLIDKKHKYREKVHDQRTGKFDIEVHNVYAHFNPLF